jgi:TPR repeat protein
MSYDPMDIDTYQDTVNEINDTIKNSIEPDYKKLSQLSLYCLGQSISEKVGKEKEAFNFFILSAQLGFIDALFQVGYCYQHGIGIEKNNRKALNHYQKAIEEGFSNDINNLIKKCKEEINENEKEFQILKISEENGNILNQIAYRYENGIGTDENKKEAFIYYQKSANVNDTEGKYNLGRCYENGIGIEKDEFKAFKLYETAAENNYSKGLLDLSRCYYNGIGIQKNEFYGKIFYENFKSLQ